MAKTRVVSGVRVTNALHIGNFFGSIANWLKLQEEYLCFFGVMDWHGLTTKYKESNEISEWTRDIIADLIAWGVDYQNHTLFLQSAVPEHLEMMMILGNLTPLGWLERVNTWKDAIEEAKQTDTHNLGRFAYPVLQAADIAVYQGALVPVGQDQIAHLELCREIVRRFNRLYEGSLPEPKPIFTEIPLLLGTDGRKMSKSYGNVFPLTAEKAVIEGLTKKMVTDPNRARRQDPGDPAKCPVFSYHKLYSSADDQSWATQGCTQATIGCGDCKAKLASNINRIQEIPREKKKELLNNPGQIDSIIAEGSEKARQEAQKTLKVVRKSMRW